MGQYGKSKVLVVKTDKRGSPEKERVSGEEMQEVSKFKYLRAMMNPDGVGYWGEESYGDEDKRGLQVYM